MSFIEQQRRKIAAMYGIKTIPVVIQKSELDNQFSSVGEKSNFVGANIHEHQRNQNSHLAKSFMNTTDYLEKGGKRAMVGEVRTYGGQKWVKHSDGWVHVSDKGKTKLHANDGKMSEGSEDHTKHFNTHVERHSRESGSVEKKDEISNEKKKIVTDEHGIHSVEHKGGKHWSKPGESKDSFKERVKKIIKEESNKDPKSLWDNNVLSNRKEIAKDAGCSRDAEYKTWSELDQKDKDILLKYWNIKESLSQEESNKDDVEFEDEEKKDNTTTETTTVKPEETTDTKITVKLVGENGNIFNLLGIVGKEMKRAKQGDKLKELQTKVFASGSYDEALSIIQQYVNVE